MSSMSTFVASLVLAASFVHEPISSYTQRNVDGFRVYVSKAASEHSETTNPALAVLKGQLDQVVRAVPSDALKTLRTIPVFVEENDPGFPCACYHTSAEWLRENGYIPQKLHSVQISNTKNFVKWIGREQPFMLLHEMAHGYHDIRYGYEDKYIVACYRLACDRGNYERVPYVNGGTQRHYALTNPMEYFAETTEAYFGKNDYYPFVRSDLKVADPSGYAMIERTWGVKSEE
jgi:hypothetical protein